MRVSPLGFALDTVADVLAEAERSAAVTHNHPEGIKGAQATALAILLARQGVDKAVIRDEINGRFGYDLNRTVAEIRPGYQSTFPVRGQSRKRSLPFWSPRTSKARSASPSLWVATATRWRISPVGSPRPFMASQRGLLRREKLIYRKSFWGY